MYNIYVTASLYFCGIILQNVIYRERCLQYIPYLLYASHEKSVWHVLRMGPYEKQQPLLNFRKLF